MPRGGKRPGAGRKVGSLTRRTREIAESASKSGETPLEYMLRVMRDPTADPDKCDEMAKAAAPYVHARLAATMKAEDDEKLQVVIMTSTYEDKAAGIPPKPYTPQLPSRSWQPYGGE